MTGEDLILAHVVAMLRFHRIRFCHVPNERAGNVVQQSRWNKLGRQPGVPDILIFDRPPNAPSCVGAVLELKTETAAKSGVTIRRQQEWLSALSTLGWATALTYGKDAAMQQLKNWGYVP
jgi:hypothetical protein